MPGHPSTHRTLDRQLSEPANGGGSAGVDAATARHLLDLVAKSFPGWSGVDDPRFVDEEIRYKREASEEARRALGREELTRLVEGELWDEVISRLERIGKSTNLLYLAAPSTSDLAYLYVEGLDKPAFCRAVLDLLHGPGDSPARLSRFVESLAAAGLTPRWTFPTYFLFLLDPDRDYFVKPRTTRWFLDLIGAADLYEPTPSGETYEAILGFLDDLRRELAAAEVQVRDMIDLQSIVWTASSEDRNKEEAVAHSNEPEEHEAPPPAESQRETPPAPAFTARTFELLEGLHDDPTLKHYSRHKDDFRRYVEMPLKELLRKVADRLPTAMLSRLETEKGLFGRIPKNDWGRGGAWDFLWGALYPKGGRRLEDVQLLVCLQRDRLETGLYFGSYSSEAAHKYQSSYRRLGPVLRDEVWRRLAGHGLRCDERDGSRTLEELGAGEPLPSRPPAEAPDRLWKASGRDVLERTPMDALAAEIAELFEALYPLALLAMEDDNLAEIGRIVDPEPGVIQPKITLSELASEVHLAVDRLTSWERAIRRKGQAILYGPPGTGKTFLAEHFADYLIGGGRGFRELIQLHPSYAYEDFIQGIRPERTEAGLDYRLRKGRFLEVCERARETDDPCVLILDEINRANLSRVFGELMFLLEYRDREVPLAAGGRPFSIPRNLFLLGTMNTADRSIALVDFALRRRFAFLPLWADFEVLRQFHQTNGYDPEPLIRVLERVNRDIGDRHYELGASFFLRDDLADHLQEIWETEIEPYLEEHFFDRLDRVVDFRWDRVREDLEG